MSRPTQIFPGARRESLSVVIPVCNRAELVRQAIESVLPQLAGDDEIVVVDDGSTDGSAAAAAGYARVRVESMGRNRGPAAARNRGVECARNILLAFLDSDDLAPPDRFARQAALLPAAGAPEIVFGAQWRFEGEPPRADARPALSSAAAGAPVDLMATTMFLRRATFLDVGPFDEALRLGDFVEWYGRALARGLRSVTDPGVVLWRRTHGGDHLSREVPARLGYARAIKQLLDRRRAAAGNHGDPAQVVRP